MIDLTIDINIFDLVLNVVLSAGVAILTAWLSLKHFYRQEKWLRKEKKYSEIIENLVILLEYFNKEFERATGMTEYIDDNDDFIKNYDNAKREIEKLRHTTGYLINPKVNVILNDMLKQFGFITVNERQGDYAGHMDRVYGVINEALKKIIQLADKDLEK